MEKKEKKNGSRTDERDEVISNEDRGLTGTQKEIRKRKRHKKKEKYSDRTGITMTQKKEKGN